MISLRIALVASLLFPAACGGSSSGGGAFGSSFQLVSMSVPAGATWQINRPVDFVFSSDVDFSTVSLNTISIRDLSGSPASGIFTLTASNTVRFQPTCPVNADLSDAGFQIGGISYQIAVFGQKGSAGLTVRSADGKQVKDSQFRIFKTPSSTLPAVAFTDTTPGPASPVLRQMDGQQNVLNPSDDVTFIETNGGAGVPIEFEFNTQTNLASQPTEQGLNFYSDKNSQLAVIIEFDQPLNPSAANISGDRVFFEFFAPSGGGAWIPITTDVSLDRNCTATGATLRLEPQGILPEDSQVRVVITDQFEDIVGERNLLQIDNFAEFRTTTINFPSLTPPDEGADEIKEDYDLGASDVGSFEDSKAAFAEPRAIWADGQLSAAFGFSGTGGDDGLFDWVVPSGVSVLLDTNGAITINGGDIGVNMEGLASFVASKQQTVVGGRLNVRHLVIEAGATVKAQGVNPVLIQASGNILIRGVLDVSGFDRPNVGTLNTGNLPELGAAGAAGGGRGGTANFVTTASTPQGGNGFGPFDKPNLGGSGGESALNASGGPNNRRPGGGGGGRLGRNAGGFTDTSGVTFGMAAENGFNGAPAATGVVTGLKPPRGGVVGPLPFLDADQSNNFFGTSFNGSTIILGELSDLTAGPGGGAGGNAIPSAVFPNPNWTVSADEKGAGGGGGGGSLHVLALGNIIIQDDGLILSNGGRGASGENVNYLDKIGGGSGGGAGGHIVLEAGSQIVFDNAVSKCISAQGGAGGEGSGTSINDGGSGGPGLIQLHVLDTNSDIVFQNAKSTANTVNEVTFPDAQSLVPTFGARSRARSKWIAIGGVNVDSGGVGSTPVAFDFLGTDLTTGFVLDGDDDDFVDFGAPLLGPVTLVSAPSVPFVGTDLRTLTVDASALVGTFNDIYLRNPQLLRDTVLELREVGSPGNFKRFNVATASADLVNVQLTLEIDGAPSLDFSTFTPVGAIEYLLYPNSLRVVTDGVQGFMPDNVTIQVMFEGAPAGPDGQPDLSSPSFISLTPDIGDLNVASPDFIRFEVLFDLDALDAGLSATSPRPALDFLRIRLRF